MPDYSRYEIPTVDYYPPTADCNACQTVILEEESFTVKELLEAIEKHESECDPKVWLYRHGYVRNIEVPNGVTNRHECWFKDEPMTESEKVAKEAEIKNYAPSDNHLVEFVRRHW